MLTELDTCSWIDYNTWFPGDDPFSADVQIGNELKEINDEACAWAYAAFFCASKFPKCNEHEDGPLPVCKETCYELLNHCDSAHLKGITSNICDALPDTECTSKAKILSPSLMDWIPYVILVYLWTAR